MNKIEKRTEITPKPEKGKGHLVNTPGKEKVNTKKSKK